jgi:hypothetical protein
MEEFGKLGKAREGKGCFKDDARFQRQKES